MKTRSVIVAGLVLVLHCFSQAFGGMDLQKIKGDGIAKAIQRFESDGHIEDIQLAQRQAMSIPEDLTSKEWLVTREEKLRALLSILASVKDKVKPGKFNELPPTINVPVPGSPWMEAGVDPSSIKDSQLRARYEAAILENNRKLEAVKHQYQLNKVYDQIISYAKSFIGRTYGQSGENEVKKIISEILGADSEKVVLPFPKKA